jgi:hypothetical protein
MKTHELKQHQVTLTITELKLINAGLLGLFQEIVKLKNSLVLFEDSVLAKSTEIEAKNVDLLLAKLNAIVEGDDPKNDDVK